MELKGPSGVVGPAPAGAQGGSGSTERSLPCHSPQHGSLRTQGERICHTEWRDSHILKSKRSIMCGQRLAPSGREGETQVAAGLPTPLKDTEPLSRAVTAPPPGSGLPCTPATPASLNPRGPAASSPAIAFQRTPGEHRQRGAGAEKSGYRGRTPPSSPTCLLGASCLGSSCRRAHSGQLASPLLPAPKGLGSPWDHVPQEHFQCAPDRKAVSDR